MSWLCFSCTMLSAQQVRFIPNKGQWEQQVLFKANIPGGDLYITRNGLVYNLYDEKALHDNQHNGTSKAIMGHALFLNFVAPSGNINVHTDVEYATAYNFYLGNDPDKWATNVKAVHEVVLQNVYPNIDFRITGADGGVKTAFIVRKGGDRNRIRWEYEGASQVTATEDNQLVIDHSLGSIHELPPVSFITNTELKGEYPTWYVMNGNMVSYNVLLPKALTYGDSLVIDPSIVFSTFSGSVADNFGFTATFDKDEYAYTGGTVYSVGFPTTPGAYQVAFGGGPSGFFSGARDVGILKYSADGKQLLYATYLGGNQNEQPHSMSCDASGNLFVMGTTRSANFPVKDGFDLSHNGGYDLFVACLDPSGTNLLSSTFIGGAANDGINGEEGKSDLYPTNYNYGDAYRGDIRLDASGNVFIATVTQSNAASQGLPVVNASQADFGGGLQDGWVIRLNHSLSQLVFSSYIGGNGVDAAYAVRIDDGKLYIAGGSSSNNLPGAPATGALAYRGGTDGFIASFTVAGNATSLNKTIYHGTASYDQCYFISTDKENRVYVTGQTNGTLARTGNVYHENDGRQFITVFNDDLSAVMLQSAFGSGSTYPKLSPSAFMVDRCDRVYLSGWGGATNRSYRMETGVTTGLVTTPDAYQRSTDGSDFYLIIFNKDLASIGYATFFGGAVSNEHVDGGTSHFSEDGAVYQAVCAGCGGHSDFPTTVGAYSRTNNGRRPQDPTEGGCNNAIFKFDARPTPVMPEMRDTVLVINVGDTIDYLFDITDANGDSLVIRGIESSLFGLPGAPPEVDEVDNRPGLIRSRLRWATDCNTKADTFYIQVRFKEISCDDLAETEGVIKVIVNNVPPFFVDLNCLKQVGDETFEVSWNPFPFNKYINRINVYRSVNNGPFDSLTAIQAPFLVSSITDMVAKPESDNYCYRIVGVNSCNTRSNFSRQSCSLEGDTFSPGAYNFAHDTVLYIQAGDTLRAMLTILDNEFADSMYLSFNGPLLTTPNAQITHQNGAGVAHIGINMVAGCDQVFDTLLLNFAVHDNQCPTPLRDGGTVRIVVLPVPEAPSVNLLCLKYINDQKVGIRWRNDQHSKFTIKYNLVRQNSNGVISSAGYYDVMNTGFIEQPVTNPFSQKQCFALVSIDLCNNPSDTGEFTCTPWPDSLYPPGFLPHYVSVAGNKDIEVSWPSSSAEYSELYRTNRNSDRKQLLYTATAAEDTLWIDRWEELNVQMQSYCYHVEPVNECGLKPLKAPKACSIVLSGTSKPFEHGLTWDQYVYFKEGTGYYELYAKDLTEIAFSLKGLTGNDTACTDDRLNKETGVFYYEVVAVENGMKYQSRSNTIELRQKPLLYVPNAFTPNNDQLNDTWNIVPVFVKDYQLAVYDRWGRKVFETTDKHVQLTGKDQNMVNLPCDVYVYVITYTGFSGEVFTRTGNVTVLK